ncbi:MAG TPA: DinB family protein [Blastocatellia bacterium]|nr:DinB family protein [Blastocatellia bacterium]
MSESNRIGDQLRRSFEGAAWHGPSLEEVLAGVTAEKAAAHPIPGVHSIWEIVLHITTWEDIVRRRLEGEDFDDPPPEIDWKAAVNDDEHSWQAALDGLKSANLALRDAISRIDDSRLKEIIPRKNYSVYYMLHGVIQHDLYHGGQIAILKKA